MLEGFASRHHRFVLMEVMNASTDVRRTRATRMSLTIADAPPITTNMRNDGDLRPPRSPSCQQRHAGRQKHKAGGLRNRGPGHIERELSAVWLPAPAAHEIE